MNMRNLTPKQESFCNYYVESGNASEAYRRSYSCDRMKDTTIHVKASELLNNGKIAVRIRELQGILQEKSDISKEEAVKELTAIVRTRITDVLSVKGSKISIKKLDEMPDEAISCIASIKNTRGSVEVKFYDKITAIDRLSKMLGWDEPDQIDLKGSVPVSAWLERMSNEELQDFIDDKIELHEAYKLSKKNEL